MAYRLFVALGLISASATAAAQSFNPKPAAGEQTVTIATGTAATGNTISLYTGDATNNCLTTRTSVALAPHTNTTVLAGGTTTLTLQSALVANEVLCADLGNNAAGTDVTVTATQTGPPASPPGFDWGLVRAYFTFGGLVSQSDNQFSHTDLFMAFHLDKAYRPIWYTLDPNNSSAANDRYNRRVGVNSFFDVRLTALPVSVQPCTSSSGSSSSSSSTSTTSSGCSSSSSSSSSSPSTTPSQTQVFLNSQKSARFDMGVYAPLMLNHWYVTNKSGAATTTTRYALYAAPLAKVGFDTSVNGLNQTQQSGGTPSTVQPVGSSGSFYKFYDFGFRLGHYQMSGDPNVANDILSYLDVTWGRFSNMASLLCPEALYNGYSACKIPPGSPSAPALPWTHDWRLDLEGLLQIPASKGFSVGFSANVAQPTKARSTINGTNYVHIKPQDDLRFLFAYRFDISSIAAKLAPQ